MPYKAKTLTGYTLHSLDGEIGKVKEFYFDDHHWTIRYLVADTGNWLTGRQVLIPPHALVAVNKEEQYISINLTKKKIKDSPPLDSDKPVSLQFEDSFYGYYGSLAYWGGGSYMAGTNPSVNMSGRNDREFNQGDKAWNPHLRSTHTVSGYNIQAVDGDIGHVADFIIDDETWVIRYLIIDTRNWLPGKKILVSPQWIESVIWNDSKVSVNLLCETIRQSPEYTDESLLTRNYETELHRHYDRKGYWIDESADADKED